MKPYSHKDVVMKSKAFLLVSLISNMAWALPVENDAVISDDLKGKPQLYNEIADLIRAYGYRCDSLSGLHEMVFSRGFSVTCNKFSYSYEIEDKGGRWVVTLD